MILSLGLIITCTLLIAVVLMQNSQGLVQSKVVKTITGVKGSAVFAEKATWTLAIMVMLFSMLITK